MLAPSRKQPTRIGRRTETKLFACRILLLLLLHLHAGTLVQGAAPSEQLRCQAIHQQLLLQNLLRTYGQAGAQPAVSVALRSAVREAGISTTNGNYLAIIQSLNGQVLPALSPQFITAQPVSAQAVLALQQQPQPDPDNPTQLAALLAAMDESSARCAAAECA